ncbi:hypothetical protein CSO01_23240 [Cellulomonas soli]|uniref:Glycine zipper domain-containing protein n=2 Tax=Cellulomonas soli TaxID=931535 RepID=A0A512PEH0_9CELL|nr:hypothetical protein CSO01_23240 [Cellulomonas soli]
MAETALDYCRTDRGEWTGAAAEAFRAHVGEIAAYTQDIGTSAHAAAAGLEACAAEVERALVEVSALRSSAKSAGLAVTPTAIVAPASTGPTPQLPGAVASAADRALFASEASARARALTLADAFAVACTSMDAVSVRLATAAANLEQVRASVELLSVPVIDLAAGAFISARVEQGVASLYGQARWLRDSADLLEANTRLPGASSFPSQLYDDLDEAARLRTQSLTAVDDAARLARAGRIVGPVVGLLVTGVSIKTDIDAGESEEQAVTSNVAGLGASIAAGAATGAVLGTFFPGLGNVAGAIIGAAVGTVAGIITSGMVDSLFENGPDVGMAAESGWNDLVSTGTAVVDLATAGAEATGDALDAVGDGLTDAWKGLFG